MAWLNRWALRGQHLSTSQWRLILKDTHVRSNLDCVYGTGSDKDLGFRI